MPRIFEQALTQLVLRDDVLHPSDVQQGQQHSQELGQQYAEQHASHDAVVVQKPNEHSIRAPSDVDNMLNTQALLVDGFVSAHSVDNVCLKRKQQILTAAEN